MARVVSGLPRNEHSSAVDNGILWVRRSPPRLTLETQNDLRSAFLANYPGEVLDSNSTPGQLKPDIGLWSMEKQVDDPAP